MRWTRAAAAIAGVLGVGILALSGGSRSDPRTPPALPGLPPPFLGTAVIGNGGRTAAVDSYGNLVDLRAPGPTGRPLIEIAPERQVAGTVPADAARVARARVGGRWLPLWRADSVEQRYLPGTNTLHTVARFGMRSVTIARSIGGPPAAHTDRRWLGRARPLGAGAPRWAKRMYERSLLVLRALTDRRSGAVAAGVRPGWAHAWPRDGGAVAIAFGSAGYGPEARRVARFLLRLDLQAAARFSGSGEPLDGRDAQGDAASWVAAAARAARLSASAARPVSEAGGDWRGRADYQEKSPGDYLGNAIAWLGIRPEGVNGFDGLFETPRGLVRVAGDANSGLDSAAAWAVRPFPRPSLFPAVRRTLLRLAAAGSRYGIVPSENWPEQHPWTAPTAWSAWSLAALAARAKRAGHPGAARRDRRAALRLMAALRRAATPLGMFPERVDTRTGLPRSTTPLAWSHAFAILALRQLWPTPMLGSDAGPGSDNR